METSVYQQDGNRCSGNEKQSKIERQLEWSRRIGIGELKRIYGASLFLRCTAYLFFILAMLFFCAAVSIVFYEKISALRLCPEWTLPLPVVLLAAQYLKKLNMPSLCRKMITMLQIGLVIAIGYFFFGFVIRMLIARDIVCGWKHDWLLFLLSSFLFILMKMVFDMLWNDRSRQTRTSLIVMSLSCGIIGGIFLPSAYAVIEGVLMAGVLWIAAFSRDGKNLFGEGVLSHKQLRSVLKQKKRNVSEEDLMVAEDIRDVSRKPFWLWFAWTSFVIQGILIILLASHILIGFPQ